jgi:hypothetical protein
LLELALNENNSSLVTDLKESLNSIKLKRPEVKKLIEDGLDLL